MRRFEERHPVALLIFYMVVIIPAMFLMSLPIAVMLLVTGTIYQIRLVRRGVVQIIFGYLVMTIVITIVNALVVHEGATELLFINGRAVTLEAVRYGFTSGLMLCAAFAWFACFSKVMTSEKLIYLFRRMPKLGLLFTMILKFVPDYIGKYREVSELQRDKSVKQALKNLSAVFSWALYNALETADAAELRHMLEKKVSRGYSFTIEDILLTVISLLSVGLYFVRIHYTFIILGIVYLIPEIYMVKEQIRWKNFITKAN